jgi:hypothetical protein
MAEHKILGKKTIAEEMWFWSEESEEIFGGGLENAVTLALMCSISFDNRLNDIFSIISFSASHDDSSSGRPNFRPY